MARILIADDELAILDVLRQTCELDEHDVRTVATVDETIAVYLDFAPDLMILDANMPPDGGARRILERLDAAGGTGTCQVIVVTGDAWAPDASGLDQQPRVCEIIQKPFNIAAIRAAVLAALKLPKPGA